MALKHAVLALLAEGPSYGYELKANFEDAVGPQWGGLNIGHVYQILDRLHQDGLVSSHHMPQDSRPDRTVYSITSAGQRDLDTWLAEPTTRAAGYRDDFILKVLAAGRRGSDDLQRVCVVQRDARLAELQTLRATRRSHRDDPLAALTIEAAILHTQADLKLVDAVEATHNASEQAPPAATGTGSEIGTGDDPAADAAARPRGSASRNGRAAST